MTVETYIVSAEHPSEEYRLDHKPVRVFHEVIERNGVKLNRYQAYCGKHPYGESFMSPTNAIINALVDNGCTKVYIHRRAPREANG